MRVSAGAMALAVPIALLLICGFAGDPAQNPGSQLDADLIVTSAPEYLPPAVLRGPGYERFPKGAQLLLFHEGKAEPLVEGFAATADADVSFDAKTVLFAGKKSRGDPWQIWELTLEDRSLRRVIATAMDAERPFYLPGGRMVWAERTSYGFELESSEDGHPPSHSFWNPTAGHDSGPGVLPLTSMRASAFPTDVLLDGRILFILFEAGFPLGAGETPVHYRSSPYGSQVSDNMNLFL